jgi:hypothetical protein
MPDKRATRFEPAAPSSARGSYVREGLLLLGFVAIVAASVITVALPELSDAAEPEPAEQAGEAAASTPDAG